MCTFLSSLHLRGLSGNSCFLPQSIRIRVTGNFKIGRRCECECGWLFVSAQPCNKLATCSRCNPSFNPKTAGIGSGAQCDPESRRSADRE